MTSTIRYEDYESAKQLSAALAREAGYSRNLYEGDWMDLSRLVGLGSSAVGRPVDDYGPILSHIRSSSFIVDCRRTHEWTRLEQPKVSSAFEELVSLSVVEQVQELLAALSMNKSQLAEVLRVTRPTLYDWLQGTQPNSANTDRLHALLRILVRASVSGATPLNARFVRQSMSLDTPPIIELLAERELDENRIVKALAQAQDLAAAASRRRTSREDRLRALGFEEPSRDERRERLAKSAALKDWPR